VIVRWLGVEKGFMWCDKIGFVGLILRRRVLVARVSAEKARGMEARIRRVLMTSLVVLMAQSAVPF
jgi:hypothetical protein